MISFGEQTTLVLEAAALTHPGQRRKLNQDAVFQQTVQIDGIRQAGLYMVCDGLGGHRGGEIASRLAVETVVAELETVLASLKEWTPTMLKNSIETAVKAANTTIHNFVETNEPDAFSMGTTLTLALIYDGRVCIAHIGDSRAYLYRNGGLVQITRDHSLVAQLVECGVIDEDEADNHPYGNILSQAVGVEADLSIDLFEQPLQPGDRLLLCSDGLWKAFPNNEALRRPFIGVDSAADCCDWLVAEANSRDGSDNISAVTVFIKAVKQPQSIVFQPVELFETPYP